MDSADQETEAYNDANYWKMPFPAVQTPREKDVKDLKKQYEKFPEPKKPAVMQAPSQTPRRSEVPVKDRVSQFDKLQ